MKTTKDLKKELNIFFQNKQPLIIEWEAGIWKTAIVEEFANEQWLPIHKILASTLDETDIAWIIVHDKETNSARTISPLLAKYCQEPCIVFLDEINCWRKETQDTLLTLIQSRVFPNWDTIHEDVWFVSAQNPALKYNNYEMSPAMKNRFAWLYYKADEYTFANYLKTKEQTELKDIIIEWLEKWDITFSDYNEDANTFTSPRSLSNLLKCVNTKQELVEYAWAFVSNSTHLYLKTISLTNKQCRENEIFDKWFTWFKLKATKFINY